MTCFKWFTIAVLSAITRNTRKVTNTKVRRSDVRPKECQRFNSFSRPYLALLTRGINESFNSTEIEMTLDEILTPSVCLIAIKSQCEAKEIMPGMHLPYYQVTIDPRQCSGNDNGYSPSREFIRFGRAKGDELNGWIPCHEVEIFEVIAEVEDDKEIYDQIADNRTLNISGKEYPASTIKQIDSIIYQLEKIPALSEQAS